MTTASPRPYRLSYRLWASLCIVNNSLDRRTTSVGLPALEGALAFSVLPCNGTEARSSPRPFAVSPCPWEETQGATGVGQSLPGSPSGWVSGGFPAEHREDLLVEFFLVL